MFASPKPDSPSNQLHVEFTKIQLCHYILAANGRFPTKTQFAQPCR